MTYEGAVAALEKNKLKAEKIEETSKTIKEGIVISQETDANTTANAGDTVKIHVSIGTGVNQVVMPNVLGKTEADAKSALEAKLGSKNRIQRKHRQRKWRSIRAKHKIW